MSVSAKLRCDRPGCTWVHHTDVAGVARALRDGDWTTETVNGEQVHTCPNHGPGSLGLERRLLADAGRTVREVLCRLDEDGYYVTGHPSAGGGASLNVQSYDGNGGDEDGPFVQISQSGRTFTARMMAGGRVVVDEDSEVWD